MTPLLLFLLLSAAIYLGTVTAAFSALMRLSLRIMAERSERGDALGPYLEDPRRLFVPARLLLSAILILAAALIGFEVQKTGIDTKIAEIRSLLDSGGTAPTAPPDSGKSSASAKPRSKVPARRSIGSK